jgi:phosphatidylglycerol---prolipoprotein diacylglyceryl transferase
MTCWFDVAPNGEPYQAIVHFAGRRMGCEGEPGPRQHFTASETVERVVPGSGRLAVTTRVLDIDPGDWTVSAAVTTAPAAPLRMPTPAGSPKVSASGTTGFAPVVGARAPGAHLGAWPALAGVGVVVALAVQSRLVARIHASVGATLLVSLMAGLVGLLGARVYYVGEHWPGGPLTPATLATAGLCLQGFVLAAVPTAGLGALVAGIPLGGFLDATAPALLLGLAVGRCGCFLGGCCAGRPTASRWGMWSSDRRVGVRRVPVQLLEAGLALSVGAAALLVVLRATANPPGAVFVAAIAAYTFGRQLLFPWRELPRHTAHGRTVAMAVTLAVMLADVALVAFG